MGNPSHQPDAAGLPAPSPFVGDPSDGLATLAMHELLVSEELSRRRSGRSVLTASGNLLRPRGTSLRSVRSASGGGAGLGAAAAATGAGIGASAGTGTAAAAGVALVRGGRARSASGAGRVADLAGRDLARAASLRRANAAVVVELGGGDGIIGERDVGDMPLNDAIIAVAVEGDAVPPPIEMEDEEEVIEEPPHCSICITDYCVGDSLRPLPYCGHIFHAACVDPWLTSTSATCPLCRTSTLDAATRERRKRRWDRRRRNAEADNERLMAALVELGLADDLTAEGVVRGRRREEADREMGLRLAGM
ncbi:hypothetical protein HK101_002878 [Irineochytrium annulatum]|nr:hypothetical protein HK101_002878 [Irineochytrium annulatum]